LSSAATRHARLRPHLEAPENVGKVVVIDVETGRYAIAETAEAADDLAREKSPDGEFYAIRIGYPAVESMGGRLRSNERK
jgi:hypothetical protein